MMKKPLGSLARVVSVLLASTLVVGCASGPSGLARNADAKAAIRESTQIFVGNCITRGDPEVAPLVAAVLPSLISQTFNLFGRTLEASASEQTWTASASTNFETSETNFPKCIQIVRGQFYASPKQADFSWIQSSRYAKYKDLLQRRAILLAAEPDFFFEGVFRPAARELGVWTIVPVVANFQSPIGERAFRSDMTRYVKIGFAFHRPGHAATESSNPSTDLILGQLAQGAFVDFDQSCTPEAQLPASAVSPPLPVQPGGSPGAATRPAAAPAAGGTPKATEQSFVRACAQESSWFHIPPSETLQAMSLTVAVTEVQGESEFLKFLSAVFNDSKADLEAITKKALIASEREKARLATLQAQHDASVAYDEAASAALTSLDACSQDGAVAKVADARIKQQAANLSAEKAGRNRPFRLLVELTTTPDKAKAACAEAIKNFQ